MVSLVLVVSKGGLVVPELMLAQESLVKFGSPPVTAKLRVGYFLEAVTISLIMFFFFSSLMAPVWLLYSWGSIGCYVTIIKYQTIPNLNIFHLLSSLTGQ